MANPVGLPLPPPYKGENFQLPVFSIQNPYCERLHNFENDQGVLSLRQGQTRWTTLTGVMEPVSYGSEHGVTKKLFVMTNNSGYKWYDCTTAGVNTLVHSLAGSAGYTATLYFKGYQFFFGTAAALLPTGTGPQQYSGSAWGTAGYSWPASFVPFGGNVFKNRAYFINLGSPAYGYSGIAAISGTVTEVDLRSVLASDAALFIIRSVSVTESVTPENVQAFIFSNGEVLVYSGSYPDASDWAIVSRFQISNTLFYNLAIDAKGDSFILTNSEILSLRNLYINGYSKERESGIGATIQPRWQQIVATVIDQDLQDYVQGVYDDSQDRLVISLPWYVDPDTGEIDATRQFCLIYDFKLGAWIEQYHTHGTDIFANAAVYHDQRVFISVSGAIFQLDTKDNYLDDGLVSGEDAIEFVVRSAPAPISKYGVALIGGIEAIMESDIYSSVNWKVIGDLGLVESEEQPMNGVADGLAKPMMNVGIEGSILQYEISGSSADSELGINIYSTNFWITPSKELAR